MTPVERDGRTLAERVADKSGADKARVDGVLAAHAVPVASVPSARRSLRVLRVRLRGEKSDIPSAGPFDRTFRLPTGVVLAVAPNLRGKTSLLEVIALCIRGTPRELQQDVAIWLQDVECDIELNGIPVGFRVKMSGGGVASGRVYQADDVESVERGPGPRTRTLIEAASGQEYAAEVAALMLDRLGLEPLVASLKTGGVQTHGWPSYFGALYPPTGAEKILIGETSMAGLAGRLLTVFLDLPGAALLTRVRAARDAAKGKVLAQTERVKAAASQTERLRQEQQDALRHAQSALAALPAVGAGLTAADLASRITTLAGRLADEEADWRGALSLYRQAKSVRQVDERALNNARESNVARRLFHGLDPAACPRCERAVDEARKAREIDEHLCAVCTSPVEADEDAVVADVVADLEATLAASRAAEQDALRALEQAEAVVAQLTTELETAETDLRAARDASEAAQRAELLTAIARAEGALTVLANTETVVEDDPDLVVLEALTDELENDLKIASVQVFDALGEEIAVLARAFGIEAVTAIKIDRRAALKISKGGVDAGGFGSQSPGERLRLRVATVLALLRVGRRLGIATHPGLLMIDSLRAEEVQESDAHALLDALVAAAADTPGLQVLTTSADETLPEGRLDEGAVLRPPAGSDALW